MKSICINNESFRLLIPRIKIKNKINKIAKTINREYIGRTPLFIGILNGAFFFMADLLRQMKIDYEIDFLKLSSYGNSKISSGRIKSIDTIEHDLKGRDIIIVEDVVDSGLSVNYVKKLIARHKPKSIRTLTLLQKDKGQNNLVKIDYIGFRIPNIFVIGYGLDYAQKGRNLTDIYGLEIKENK